MKRKKIKEKDQNPVWAASPSVRPIPPLYHYAAVLLRGRAPTHRAHWPAAHPHATRAVIVAPPGSHASLRVRKPACALTTWDHLTADLALTAW
jgi:hypothetical protein